MSPTTNNNNNNNNMRDLSSSPIVNVVTLFASDVPPVSDNFTTDSVDGLDSVASEAASTAPRYSWLHTAVASIVVTAIMLVIVLGNALVVVAIALDRSLKGLNTSLKGLQNWFIASLAVSDLLVGLFIMPLSLTNELLGYWVFGDVLCQLWLSTDVLLCTASILNLVLISLDRYWSITRAVSYLRLRTPRLAAFMISAVWTLSGVICFPPLAGWSRPQPVVDGRPLCVLSEEPGYVIYSIVGSFYLPLIVMVCVYIKIYMAARWRARRNLKTSGPRGSCVGLQTTTSSTVAVDHRPRTSIELDMDQFDIHSNIEGCSDVDIECVSNQNSLMVYGRTSPSVRTAVVARCLLTEAETDKTQSSLRTVVPNVVTFADSIAPPSSPVSAAGSPPSTNDVELQPDVVDQHRPTDDAVRTTTSQRRSVLSGSAVANLSRREDSDNLSIVSSSPVHKLYVDDEKKLLVTVTIKDYSSIPRGCGGGNGGVDAGSPFSTSTSPGVQPSDMRRLHKRFRPPRRCSIAIGTVGSAAARPSSAGGTMMDETERTRKKAARARERRATFVLGVVMVSFIGCWLPFFAVYPISLLTGMQVPEPVFGVIFWLGYCNSALNPIIYTVFNRDFRRAFQKILFGRITRAKAFWM